MWSIPEAPGAGSAGVAAVAARRVLPVAKAVAAAVPATPRKLRLEKLTSWIPSLSGPASSATRGVLASHMGNRSRGRKSFASPVGWPRQPVRGVPGSAASQRTVAPALAAGCLQGKEVTGGYSSRPKVDHGTVAVRSDKGSVHAVFTARSFEIPRRSPHGTPPPGRGLPCLVAGIARPSFTTTKSGQLRAGGRRRAVVCRALAVDPTFLGLWLSSMARRGRLRLSLLTCRVDKRRDVTGTSASSRNLPAVTIRIVIRRCGPSRGRLPWGVFGGSGSRRPIGGSGMP